MGLRIAEHTFRARLLGPKRTARVDLHGVSVFGPGGERTLIRWEYISAISVAGGVVVSAPHAELVLPKGAFGCPPERLAELLREAGSIAKRADVIEGLAAHG
ncbi:MAG: hypothetical protein ACRD0D_07925 [Acidimicrobiales bacterium]